VNVVLVAGCAAGGLVTGGFLDSLTGRIVRPPDAASDPASGAVDATSSAPAGAIPVTRVVVAARAPGAGELAASALVTGAAFGLLAIRLGAAPALAAYCSLLAGLLAASVVDIRLGIVPRSILYPTFAAMAVGLAGASAVDSHWRALGEAAIGGAAAFAVFFALWWFFPRGLGYGDVRLAGVMGAALGWIGFGELYVGFLVAFVAGTVVGVVLMARQGAGRKTRFAFGPSLTVGAAFGVLWGPWAVHIWLHHG
jgi:leader peptidase (prepilin peptidase)/N-methyltransferase